MKYVKRVLSLILVSCMVLSLSAFNISAEEIVPDADITLSEDTSSEESESAPADTSVLDEKAEEAESGSGEQMIPGDENAMENESDAGDIEAQVMEDAASVSVAARDTGNDGYYKIVHLDCGRKYFYVDSVKTLIDAMAVSGYNQLELAFGNAGLRFMLSDMSIQVSDTVSYSDAQVRTAIQTGNAAQNSSNVGSYWSEADMNAIISYAKDKGIEIVPLLNMPGHMNALLSVKSSYALVDTNKDGEEVTSADTLDLNNAEARAFGLAVLQKYVNYFKSNGVKFFNFGADEYGNDIYNPYFNKTDAKVSYSTFLSYFNDCAKIIKEAGMTPRAFNDFVYYNNQPGADKDVQVCYWSNQWGSSPYVSANTLAGQGYTLINTNQDWYYVPGSTGYTLDTAKDNARTKGLNQFKDGSTVTSSGAMVCIWCDNPNAATDTQVISDSIGLIQTLATANPTVFTISEDSGNDQITSENREISVQAYGTTSDKIEGAKYSETDVKKGESADSIVTVSVQNESVPGSADANKADPITSGNTYIIGNGSQYLKLSGTTISSTSNVEEATQWTITESDGSYTIQNGSYYLRHNNNSLSASNSNSNSNRTWNYDSTKGFYYNSTNYGYTTTYYLNYNNSWRLSQSTTSYGAPYSVTTSEAVDNTVVTFTGVAAGETTVTVGNVNYTIHVTAEDPTTGGTKNILYHITNKDVTGEDGATSKAVTSEDVYGEDGKAISELVPATGKYNNGTYEVKYLKTQYLTGNDRLPSDGGWTNCSNKGTTVTRIRYYAGKWSVMNGEGTWIDVVNESDIVAYYLHKTDVTDEVTTYVTDWGDDWGGATQIYGTYGLYDFSVVYPSSDNRRPSDFGNTDTMLFNTNALKDYAVYNGSGDVVGRYVNDVHVEASDEYEVYMITVIRNQLTDNLPTKDITSSYRPTYSYSDAYAKSEEQIIWVDNESSIPAGTEMTKADEYTVGGEAVIPTMKVYHKQALLFTYYLRVKPTEDSLKVHYVDESTGEDFYGYDIAVNEGVVFDEKIALDDPWKGDLVNATIKSLKGEDETVTADLSKMSQIGAQYRYSSYTCTKVERSENGKEVYLYYKFDNTHTFVVDYGLPITITKTDMNISGDWTSSSVIGAHYGETEIKGGELIYTPTQTLRGFETIQLQLKDADGSVVQHQIYIYPATTVYYEEGFAKYTDGWTVGSTETVSQKTETPGTTGNNNYGYDGAYANALGASNDTEAVSSTKGASASFAFTGTGVDTYANCSGETGTATIQIRNKDDRMVKLATVSTTATGTYGKQVSDGAYNTPIISVNGLTYGEYTEKVFVAEGMIKLDGFRVYGTLENMSNNVYVADDEDNPSYFEMRDAVLTAKQVSSGTDAKTVYDQVYQETDGKIDGAIVLSDVNAAEGQDPQTLLKEGPKNELYLAPKQALVFKVTTNREVQIGLKAPGNTGTTYTINGQNGSIGTCTDMFYTVLKKTENISEQEVTIINTGDGLLSVTKLKICDDPNASLGELTADDLTDALVSLGVVEPTDPEPTYADASLTIQVDDAATTLTKNGVEGETATFTSGEIKEAAESLVVDGYNLNDAAYTDVEVAYGQNDTVTFTASEDVVEPEPTNIFKQIIDSVRNFFGKIFGRR